MRKSSPEFRLTDNFIEKYKELEPPFGYNGLGKFVYMRTYSRIKSDGKNEEWWETVRRVVEGIYNIQKDHIDHGNLGWNAMKAQKSAQEMYDLIFNIKFLPSGRSLWAMGTDVINEKRLTEALYSCSFISTENIKDDISYPFMYAMDMLMCGVGVGFDVRGAGSIEIQTQTNKTEEYIIPDTREGWVESVGKLIRSFFGGPYPIFDYSKIRPEGTPIKTFGGISAGSEPLKELHRSIKFTLSSCIGNQISERNIVDIFNFIGRAVVSGNVRRCLPIGTKVHTTSGLKNIEDITPNDYVYTSNGVQKIKKLYDQGKQKTIVVRTQIGNMKCTENHRVAVLKNPYEYQWKMAKNLTSNDKMAFIKQVEGGKILPLPPFHYEKSLHSTTCQDIKIPKLDTGIAWLFGYMHGNGYIYPNFENNGFNAYVAFVCHNEYASIINFVKEQLSRFGINVYVRPQKSSRYSKIEAQSKQLAWYLSQFKNSNQEIKIPYFILGGTSEIKSAYLAGLFDADGSSKTRPINAVTTVYKEYAKSIQNLYSTLGIPTRIKVSKRKNKSWKNLIKINIVGEQTKIDFASLIGQHSFKYQNGTKTKRSQNDFSYSKELLGNIGINTYLPNNKIIFSRFNEKYDPSRYIPIDVINISDGNTVQTFDIEVENDHEFIINQGFLVHNSAQLALGEETNEFINLKNYEINPERLDYGWVSNNSVLAEIGMDYKNIADHIKINGEPGCIWIDNVREYSRLLESEKDNKDFRVAGLNPCGEIGLESSELCNLCEVFPDRIDDKESFIRTLKYAYLFAKSITLLETNWIETNRVMMRNRRLGISITGVAQFIAHRGVEELRNWLTEGYQTLKKYDDIYSDWFAIPRSVKLTTTKPSGTVSLLGGATSGVHYPESTYYIRRVRLAKNSPLINPLKIAGYKIEKAIGQEDSTVVVEFPVFIGEDVRTQEDVSMWEQLSQAAFMQKYWADNSVSVTVTFNPETEGKDIERALDFYQYQLKAVSFLPRIKDGAYPQMPYEKIDQKTYEKIISKLTPINFSNMDNASKAENEKYCTNDICSI